MKPLEISEEQKAKLLEMCKVLFPEYINIEITKGKHVKLFSEWKNHGSHISYKIKDTASIHWFEFCVIQLIPKLFQNNETYGFTDNTHREWAYMWLGDDEHPIDYLYEQFKKL